jgi:hypothetical protein
MTTKKINSNDLAADIQAGMDHEQLMEKYDLPSDTLQRFYRELAAGGGVNKELLAADTDPLDSAAGPAWKCPACGYSQSEAFDECPVCGVVVRKFKKGTEQEPNRGSRDDDMLHASRWPSDADEDDADVDDDAEHTSDASPEVHSGGIVSHVLEWMSDTASSISETISETVSEISQSVSDLTSGSGESAEGESAGDDSSDGGDSGGDSGSDGGGGGD